MIERADVVVIGSGGLGAATAFYLARSGGRHDLASQTSPRAAGLVAHARSTDLMVELVKLAVEGIERFTADTGQPLGWTRSGSLKVARRAEDADVLEAELARVVRHGLDAEQTQPDA